VGILQQLRDLHEIDQHILAIERELGQYREELTGMSDGVSGLETGLERLEGELERARDEARRAERAVDERRDTLDRIRTRVNQVQNERQYSAASLEFDLVRQELRKLEDRAVERLQVVEDLENRRNDILEQLESARSEAGPRGVEIVDQAKQLEGDLAIKRDRRDNLAIRIDSDALGLYNRIRAGRSQVGLAQLTEEDVCGYCFTSVTIQQKQQIKSMKVLVCCEGCGVILYPGDLSA
jgi:predicted  nucleic acid-binding Zn-ribbon protein